MTGVIWKRAATFGLAVGFLTASAGIPAFAGVPAAVVFTGNSSSPRMEGVHVAQAQPRELGGANSIITLDQPAPSRFVFTATRKSGGTSLDGNVPSDDLAKQLASGGVDATGLRVTKGAPAGFEAAAATGLKLLALLEEGKLEFDGKAWSLTGTAKDPLQAMNAEAAFKAANLSNWRFAVELPKTTAATLPKIEPYSFKAEKLPAGTIALSGYLPTAGMQAYLAAQIEGNVVDTTKLGAGGPENFAAAALAGVDALQSFDEGVVLLKNGRWSFTARTDDAEVAANAKATLAATADTSGWQVAITAPEALPLVADPFTWSATKAADGSYTLSGHVGNEGLRRYIAVRAGTIASDTMEIARGEPEGFVNDVLAGLAALEHLQSGTVSFDGTGWSLSGTSESTADGEAAVAALATATTAPASWRTAIDAPLAAAPEPTALASEEPVEVAETAAASAATPAEPAAPIAPAGPPLFDAVRTAGGPLALRGAVPAEAARSYFGVIAGNVPTDQMSVAGNMPADFIPNARAGIEALTHLSDGEVGFDGAKWTLRGTADNDARRTAAVEALSSLNGWSTDVALTPPLELCRKELADFSARNSILFQSGRATMTDESVAALGELAADLNRCPEAAVSVEGHTDADGPEDLNLALSVARAEAVVAELVALGVAEERLYAVGYGESLPVASNDTAKGKQANRRIVFNIADENE